MFYSQPDDIPKSITNPESAKSEKNNSTKNTDKKDENTCNHQYNILNNIKMSWQRLKDSTSEFMQSHNEIYKNVMTTNENFQINEEIFSNKDNLISKKVSINFSNKKNLARLNSNEEYDYVYVYEDESQKQLLYKSYEDLNNIKGSMDLNRFSVEGILIRFNLFFG